MTQRPARFEAYPTDRFIEIVKTWIDRPWPITSKDGRMIFEDLGYSVDSEDPEMFASPFAEREPDSYYIVRNGFIDDIDVAVSTVCARESMKDNADTIESTYDTYCKAVSGAYPETLSRRDRTRNAVEWFFKNDAQIRLSNIGITISFIIHSPRMTRLRREEEEMALTSYDEILEDD